MYATTRLVAATLLSTFMLSLVGAAAVAQLPDPDHLIYVYDPEIPPFRKWKHHQDLIGQRRQTPPSADGLNAPRKWLKWTFKLTKDKFVYGEVVWGKIRVENTNPNSSYIMSPPGHSRFVSTIGVWTRSRVGHENRDTDEPGELKESTEINKGNYYNHYSFRGRPITLAPGESYEAMIPVNVNQIMDDDTKPSLSSSDRTGWSPTPIYGKGKHQFYLQYVNAEGLSRYRYKVFSGNSKPEDLYPPRHIRFDGYPLVLGPYEFEVERMSAGRENLLANCQRQPVPVPIDKETVLHPKPHQKMVSTLARTSPLLWQFEFLYLRHFRPTYELEFANGFESTEIGETDLKLKNLEAVLSNLAADDPLRNFVQMERCERLHFLGYPEEAIALAEEFDSPDAQVFLDIMSFEENEFEYEFVKSGVHVTPAKEGKLFARIELEKRGWLAELHLSDEEGQTVAESELRPWQEFEHRRSTVFGVYLATEQLKHARIYCHHPKEGIRCGVALQDFHKKSDGGSRRKDALAKEK